MAEARQKAEWARTAQTCCIIYNMMSHRRKLKPDDFTPFRSPPVPTRTGEEQQKMWDKFTKEFAKPKKGKK